jgi:hypothetical protein
MDGAKQGENKSRPRTCSLACDAMASSWSGGTSLAASCATASLYSAHMEVRSCPMATGSLHQQPSTRHNHNRGREGTPTRVPHSHPAPGTNTTGEGKGLQHGCHTRSNQSTMDGRGVRQGAARRRRSRVEHCCGKEALPGSKPVSRAPTECHGSHDPQTASRC